MTKKEVADQIISCFHGFENKKFLDIHTLVLRVREVEAFESKFTMKELLSIRDSAFAQRASVSEFTKRTFSE